jgi:hypothetical protein
MHRSISFNNTYKVTSFNSSTITLQSTTNAAVTLVLNISTKNSLGFWDSHLKGSCSLNTKRKYEKVN